MYVFIYISFIFIYSHSIRETHCIDHCWEKTYNLYPVCSFFKLSNCAIRGRCIWNAVQEKPALFNLSPFKGVAKKGASFWQNNLLPYFLNSTSTKIYHFKFLLHFKCDIPFNLEYIWLLWSRKWAFPTLNFDHGSPH
jgi:hypothetical protein